MIVSTLALALLVPFPTVDVAAPTATEVFEEVCRTVKRAFYDPEMRGLDWPAVCARYRERLAAPDAPPLRDVVNAMLGELDASHTHFYARGEQAYYDLCDIFNPQGPQQQFQPFFPDGRIEYDGIGIVATRRGDRAFVADVFESSPADDAGLLVGDEIVSVAGAPYDGISVFEGRAGGHVHIVVRRHPPPAEPIELRVDVIAIRPHEWFMRSLQESTRIIEHDGRRIGYVRIRSYAGSQYQEALRDIVLDGELADADGLVVDLRDGWGGAQPEYVELFDDAVPRLTFVDRDGAEHHFDARWRKPAALIINNGSRSGKEVVAWAFRKNGFGPLVGERTAGAVLAGRSFVLSSGDLLYVAVADVVLDGNVRLEGVGVDPDVHVPFDLEYAAGADPQLDRAVEVVAEMVGG